MFGKICLAVAAWSLFVVTAGFFVTALCLYGRIRGYA
jgi:hypothetical protein